MKSYSSTRSAPALSPIAIALDTEGPGDHDHRLRQLAELMHKCVAWQATYTVLPPGGSP